MKIMSSNTIREAVNKINVKGELVGLEAFDRKVGKDQKDALALDLEIKTAENTIMTVKMFATELTNAGKPNGIHKGLCTIRDEYEVATKDERGDIVVIQSSPKTSAGNIAINEYYSNGKLVERLEVNGTFVNRASERNADMPFGATFEVEGKIRSMIEELEGDQVTGRLLIKIVSPRYGGRLNIFELIAPADLKDAIMDTYNVGDTVKFIGDIQNEIVTSTVTTPMAIGGEKTETITNYKEGLIITQGGFPYDIDSPLHYTDEEISKALAERELYLEELEAKSKEPKKKEKMAVGGGSSPEIGGKSNSLSEEIPF